MNTKSSFQLLRESNSCGTVGNKVVTNKLRNQEVSESQHIFLVLYFKLTFQVNFE